MQRTDAFGQSDDNFVSLPVNPALSAHEIPVAAVVPDIASDIVSGSDFTLGASTPPETWLGRMFSFTARPRSKGWLGRHSSRDCRAHEDYYQPYVDLSPLDITRRH